ncbi:MAG: hypothetical protein HY961_08935 [Ignavibacteriae bacterium]|nr:hypothetical protein [Ignavibacteriota bacterium]
MPHLHKSARDEFGNVIEKKLYDPGVDATLERVAHVNQALNRRVEIKVVPSEAGWMFFGRNETTNGHSVSRVTVKPMLLTLALLAGLNMH